MTSELEPEEVTERSERPLKNGRYATLQFNRCKKFINKLSREIYNILYRHLRNGLSRVYSKRVEDRKETIKTAER